ncbi:hypothetical protein APA_1067 [Pseudanabaena sp. lw0831]|uniref:hypothetical protein n=1 Tax=Pseudanabaena sp. lw0831 TaxID=1357935 RepID=UPI0019158D96|nr:hypothetical protein [Pseudanabaena sp. lw0831]GBO53159.1 hypothetical protein APA_1067 [Pseudanabaena sp. lw0831]
MSQKPPINIAIWQWALIGAGSTIVLVLAAYGAFNLIGNSKGLVTTSASSTHQNKNSDANSQSTTNKSFQSQSVSNNLIAGTWLIDIAGRNIEVVITNDGRVIVPDPKNSSRAIEGGINIKKISSNNYSSLNGFSPLVGTWSFEMQAIGSNFETIQAVITNDGDIDIANPYGT